MSNILETLKYTDILRIVPDFISLDISVRSTGWLRSRGGKLDWGTYKLVQEDEQGRRREFKQFLKDLLGETEYKEVYVEDVIAGTNFKTTKGLIQLNTIIDDMVDDGVVKAGCIKRIDNKRWKKYLREVSGYKSQIVKEDDKALIRGCLKDIGFDLAVVQDIDDAIGIAVAIIYRDNVIGGKRAETKLKTDLRKGFEILQSASIEEMTKKGHQIMKKYAREEENIDWFGEKRDVLYLFKQKVIEEQRDDKVYKIKLKSQKLGVLALTKKLSTEEEETYIIVTKKKKG